MIDAGANLGFFSAAAAQHGAERVYAFEPMAGEIGRYLARVAEHYPQIQIVARALGDRTGGADMFSTELGYGGARLVGVPAGAGHSDEGYATRQVEVTTLDEFVRKEGLTRVDFIKADIEGAERLLLRGGRETLARFAPKLSLCKYHLPDDPEVMRELILQANPAYRIEERYGKMYAEVPAAAG